MVPEPVARLHMLDCFWNLRWSRREINAIPSISHHLRRYIDTAVGSSFMGNSEKSVHSGWRWISMWTLLERGMPKRSMSSPSCPIVSFVVLSGTMRCIRCAIHYDERPKILISHLNQNVFNSFFAWLFYMWSVSLSSIRCLMGHHFFPTFFPDTWKKKRRPGFSWNGHESRRPPWKNKWKWCRR